MDQAAAPFFHGDSWSGENLLTGALGCAVSKNINYWSFCLLFIENMMVNFMLKISKFEENHNLLN